jgi:hypothetical protein
MQKRERRDQTKMQKSAIGFPTTRSGCRREKKTKRPKKIEKESYKTCKTCKTRSDFRLASPLYDAATDRVRGLASSSCCRCRYRGPFGFFRGIFFSPVVLSGSFRAIVRSFASSSNCPRPPLRPWSQGLASDTLAETYICRAPVSVSRARRPNCPMPCHGCCSVSRPHALLAVLPSFHPPKECAAADACVTSDWSWIFAPPACMMRFAGCPPTIA